MSFFGNNFFRRIFKKNKLITKAVILPNNNPFYEWIFLNDGKALTSEEAIKFYQTNSTVATAIDMIASACEQIQPILKNPKKGVILDHNVLKKLRNPNKHETYNEFIGKLVRHFLLDHDAFPLLIGNVEFAPSEIYAVKPQNLTILPSEKDGYVQTYNIVSGVGKGEYVRSNSNDMINFYSGKMKELYHIMGFSSRYNDIKGDSPLEAIKLEIQQQLKGKSHNIALLEKGGRLSLIVTFKESRPDEDEHKERRQRLNEQLSGPDNAGGIATITGEDIDIKEVGKTNKDMDFTNLDRIAKDVIFLKYGVPLPLVSLNAATYNNVENAIYNFYENTVLPTFDTIFTGLSKVLLPRYGLNLSNYKITYNPESIPTLMRQRLKEIKVRNDINRETTNEIRELLGREPKPGMADNILMSNKLAPIDSEEESTENE